MFLITQFIGLYVVSHYMIGGNTLPFGLQPPEITQPSQYYSLFSSIVMAFVFAILIFLFLKKLRIEFILKLWFLLVIVIALSVSFLSFIPNVPYALLISLGVAVLLALIKVYGRNFLVHNITEFFVYPGIAAIFVPILNVYTVIGLLILISVYDMWAVWHSGIMQKMAKYQINKLKIFSGFFVPYISGKTRQKIKNWKKTISFSKLKEKKIKVSVAILGGGDIVFPIITAGVMLQTLGLTSAILVILGATLGLTYLFFAAEKRKFYPAMPFITAGILLGILVSYLVF